MAYFRMKKGKPWHLAVPGSRVSLCNVRATEKAVFTAQLYERETMCTNCALLIPRDGSIPKPREKEHTAQDYARMHREAQEAEERGDYKHLPHTEDILAHVAANRPLSEIAQWAATGKKP